MSRNTEIATISIADVIDTLNRNVGGGWNEDNVLRFASELTGLSEDTLYEVASGSPVNKSVSGFCFTPKLILDGMKAGVITLIDTPEPYGDGCVCKIGNAKDGDMAWFYFDEDASVMSAEEYMAANDEDAIADKIYEALYHMYSKPETIDEVQRYEAVVKEWLAGADQYEDDAPEKS